MIVSALAFSEVTVKAGKFTLLDRVSLTIEPGELLALVGPNGAGKTTLLRTAFGLARVASGSITVSGVSATTLSSRARAHELAWLPQEPLRAEPIPALEAVTAARYRFSESAAASRRAAEKSLERVGMAARAEELLSELSGGERQRVAIAALLAQEARVLLLDEPANHLDPAQQADTYALIGRVAQTGTAVLCVTHDVNLLSHVGGAPRIVGLKAGKLMLDAHYGAPDLATELALLFDVPMRAVEAGGRRFILPVPRRHSEAPPS
jgi:iron complex transport system ATP-binding protein